MEPNQRACPMCHKTVDHMDVKSATSAAKKNKPCKKCRYDVRKPPSVNNCPLCSFSSKRMTAFEQHLIDIHQTTAQEQWIVINGTPPLCKCGCGVTTTWHGWNKGYSLVVVGHNANIYAVYDNETAQKIAETRGTNWRGKPGVWLGKTKDNDKQARARAHATALGRKKAFEAGTITIWSKDKTKDTDARLAIVSQRQQQRFAAGELVPWAKGLTKDTDDRIRTMAERVSMTHKTTSLRNHLDDLKKLNVDEIQSRIETGSTLRVVTKTLEGYINDNTPNILVECSQCSSQWNSSLRRLKSGRCYTCDPGGSRGQQDVANWLRQQNINVTTNDRSQIGGQELDVFVPAHNFAIEYNGLHWHSILYKSSMYHNNKSELCQQKNIALLHLFEDEWRDKRSIIESMIQHKLGTTSQKTMARKCTIVELDTPTRRQFFNDNHIDGDTNAKKTFGLLDKANTVVAAMSLRTPFHKKHSTSLEIARFCCRKNVAVVGGLGKLTQAVVTYARKQEAVSLLSYIDTRLGTSGNSWSLAGWSFTGVTPPRFWWVDEKKKIRHNRFKFKADKKNNLTEAQVAEQAGVIKIFGCKNLVYEFVLTRLPSAHAVP